MTADIPGAGIVGKTATGMARTAGLNRVADDERRDSKDDSTENLTEYRLCHYKYGI